jgi:hypothetical protein
LDEVMRSRLLLELGETLLGTSKNEEFQACSHLQKNALRRQGVY